MSVADYPITPGYGFGGTLAPYSLAHPHLGEDRGAPLDTDVIVANTLIGKVGNTGAAQGTHAHSAKWRTGQLAAGIWVAEYNHTYFAPSDVYTTPGTVTEVSYQDVGQAGKYVRWQGADGATREVFHLNEVLVNVGDKIGGNMVSREDVIVTYQVILQKDPTEEQIKAQMGQPALINVTKSLDADHKAQFVPKADFDNVFSIAEARYQNEKKIGDSVGFTGNPDDTDGIIQAINSHDPNYEQVTEKLFREKKGK